MSGEMTVANFDQDADDLVITPSTSSKVDGATELRRAVGKSAVSALQKVGESFKKGLWDGMCMLLLRSNNTWQKKAFRLSQLRRLWQRSLTQPRVFRGVR